MARSPNTPPMTPEAARNRRTVTVLACLPQPNGLRFDLRERHADRRLCGPGPTAV